MKFGKFYDFFSKIGLKLAACPLQINYYFPIILSKQRGGVIMDILQLRYYNSVTLSIKVTEL